MCPAVEQFCDRRPPAQKQIETFQRFTRCLPTKIDASRFSGSKQCFAGAPYISLQKSNVVFSTPNRPMPMPRSIAVLENDRKLHYVAICSPKKKSTHRGFRGPNNLLLARPIFSFRNRASFFRRRIDRCRCFDRPRGSKTISTPN